jgi:hypothetical protein
VPPPSPQLSSSIPFRRAARIYSIRLSGAPENSGQSGEWKIEKWGGRPCPPAGEAGIDILIKGSGTALAAAGGIAGRDAHRR